MPERDPQSFLSRWSRLKRGEPTEKPAGEPSGESAAPPGRTESEVEQVKSVAAEPEVRIDDLPDIETLTADSDIAKFLQKGVPEHLQRLALRKAWSLDPAIRDFIEVAENQYDFNAGNVPGFGELARDVDMQRLLAQAVGADPKPPQEVSDARQVDASPEAISHAAAPHDPPMLPSEQPADRIAGEVAASANESAVPESQALGRRRRHGGALPT